MFLVVWIYAIYDAYNSSEKLNRGEIVEDSIDFNKAWYQSRYDKGDKYDYINCPLSKEEYFQHTK